MQMLLPLGTRVLPPHPHPLSPGGERGECRPPAVLFPLPAEGEGGRRPGLPRRRPGEPGEGDVVPSSPEPPPSKCVKHRPPQ